jgi:hypothetical protein
VASGLPKEGGKEVFDWLLKKGLDPLAEDKKGRSSLDLATEAKREGRVSSTCLEINRHEMT